MKSIQKCGFIAALIVACAMVIPALSLAQTRQGIA